MRRMIILLFCVLILATACPARGASEAAQEASGEEILAVSGTEEDETETEKETESQTETTPTEASKEASTTKSSEEEDTTGAVENPTSASDDEAPVSAVTLTLDSKNTYDGMETAYRKGYTPTVSGGKAIVVLPLTASGDLKGDKLTAAVDLGDTSSAPFVYKNYQKDFSLTSQKINGTEKEKAVYYVRFDLKLSSTRANGIYPVVINITAQDTSGNEISQSFTTYVTITDGSGGEDVDGGDTYGDVVSGDSGGEETPTSSPVVLVTGCAVTPSPVEAGSSFEAVVTLKNTSTLKAVQNMVVTVSSADGESYFTLLNDSDTIFLDKLGKGASTQLKLDFSVDGSTPEGQYTFSLEMSYDDSDANTLSSSGRFTVRVEQPLEVELTLPRIASSVNAGDTLPLSFQVLNLGRSSVYNVRCEVTGAGLFPTSTAFIGDMEAGSEGTASLSLFIGTKDMSEDYAGTEQYGATTGTVTLLYENAAGTEFTQEYTFDTTIEKAVTSVNTGDDEEEDTAGQWWITMGILAGILAAAGIGFGCFTLGKRKIL